MRRKTLSILISIVVIAVSVGLTLAACPSADLTGDCLVNFLDFQMMASQGSLLELHTMAAQWLESDDDPPTILSQVDMQMQEPNSFAVQFVVVGKQRVDRTVFQYECQVILENILDSNFENAHLVMVAYPDNMTIIDPHVTFGDARIGPGESAASIDTCSFTVDRSEQINPLEVTWRYVTAPEEMVFIPGGTFQMGDSFSEGNSRELPVHTVTVDSFYMGRCEVTNRQYCDYLNSAWPGQIKVVSDIVYAASDSGNSYPYCGTYVSDPGSQIDFSDPDFSVRTKSGRDMSNDPMVEVSWYGAAAYCNWRSQQEGKEQCYNLSTWACDFGKHGYRLATEAEWEYAARGGFSGRRFPWGDTITHSQANYYSSSSYSYDVSPTRGYHPNWDDVYPYTSPGGSFAANNYGLYDMAGNVSEWCNDWYGSYSSASQTNPTGPTSGSYRVLRGGCWGDDALVCRVAYRRGIRPYVRVNGFGFRCVLDF